MFDEAIQNALILRVRTRENAILVGSAHWRDGGTLVLRRLDDRRRVRIDCHEVSHLDVVGVGVKDYEFEI